MKKLYTFIFLAFICTFANAQYTKLLDFTGPNGANPCGSLISDGTYLYGMTNQGNSGGGGGGVLFKMKHDGTGYTKLYDFTGQPKGSIPQGSLISDGTFLYGMTYSGGVNNSGIIFKVKPDGTAYTDLLDFNVINGDSPAGTLIFDGTYLYGMTYRGGTTGKGVIFKIMPDGTGYAKLLDFTGANGSYPRGSLISDGTFLYGMTWAGGSNNKGVLFKINPDGTGYVTLLNFTGINGSYPDGSLISDGMFLYGVAGGGTSNLGIIFKIKPDGTGYAKLLDFTGANGSYPVGSLISDGIFFYGVTSGSIYKIKSDGTGYDTLLNFTGPNGSSARGALISDCTFLYGMTYSGGTNNLGTVFKLQKVNISGNTTIVAGESTTLTATGGSTYSWNTGNTTDAIIISPQVTTTYTATVATGTCVSTVAATVIVHPCPLVSISGNTTLYTGQTTTLTASGGTNYSWNTGQSTTSIIISPTATTTYTVTSTTGTCIATATTTVTVNTYSIAIITSNISGYGKCDGTASVVVTGGTAPYTYLWNNGQSTPTATSLCVGHYTVMVTDAYGLVAMAAGKVANAQCAELLNFNSANGRNPRGSLISDGTYLYGMTEFGGTNDSGTIFKIKPDGSGFTSLYNFSSTKGTFPQGSLFYDGNFLYGMTYGGGTQDKKFGSIGYGVLFKIKPDGSGYALLIDFADTNGSNPCGSLISDGTFLYGMTRFGGINGYGTIFKIKPDGTGYSKLLDFTSSNGQQPVGALVSDGTYLYGMTYAGGPGSPTYGVIFKIKTDGTGFLKLLDFPGGTKGVNPNGSLFYNGTFLFGMTYYGGGVFKIKPDGTGADTLLTFKDGSGPLGSVISDGGFLYGMTSQGGTGLVGTIFRIKQDGTAYSKLLDFGQGGVNGTSPTGDLISDGTYLYGMTRQDRTNGFGTVFKVCIPITVIQSPTICIGQSVTVGSHTYSISGTYHDTLMTVKGCDSIVTTNLTVFSAFTVSLGLVQDTANPLLWYIYDTITNSTPPYTYLWDFGDGTNSTQPTPSHTYTVAGHYAICLTVTDANGCIGTTCDSTYRISSGGIIQYLIVKNPLVTGIESLQNTNDISIYPNPTSGKLTIESSENKYELSISNILGEKILSQKIQNETSSGEKYEIDLSKQPNGIYFIKVTMEDGRQATQKIIVQ